MTDDQIKEPIAERKNKGDHRRPERNLPPLPRVKPWNVPFNWRDPIVTPRLTIRPTTLDDAPELFNLIEKNREYIGVFLAWASKSSKTVEEVRDFIHLADKHVTATPETNADELPGLYPWVVVFNGKIVGSHGFANINPSSHTMEIGYFMDEEYTNIGLATEATQYFISHAFRRQSEGGFGFNRCEIIHAGTNGSSGAIPRKLGFRREGWLRQALTIGHNLRDDRIIWGIMAEEWDFEEHRSTRNVPKRPQGVGPHPKPWPDNTDGRYDENLLLGGDSRNVIDKYRYWTMEAIRKDMVEQGNPFHIAVENWQHDMNIGTVVRNANAFGAGGVHIVGRRTWNKRGAMVTDRYLNIYYHDTVQDLVSWCFEHDLTLVGIDLIPGSTSMVTTKMPRNAMLLFGQEGPGLTAEALAQCKQVLHLPQIGSTRSINAGVASGAAMVMWVAQHRPEM